MDIGFGEFLEIIVIAVWVCVALYIIICNPTNYDN